MEVPLIWGGGASPKAPKLHLWGDEVVLELLASYNGPEVIQGIAIETAVDGNNVHWRVSRGGDWVLVKVPGNLQLEGYPQNRQPVGGMDYLPVHAGDRFEGIMGYGKNRSYSVYSAILTAEGVTLTPIDRQKWGDRAYDITGSLRSQSVMSEAPAPEPPVACDREEEADDVPDGAMAEALRRAGLI